jgi:uncharacterized membrane protein YgdD (TMEM256/DUF423 family)
MVDMQNGEKYYGVFAGLGGFLGVLLGALAAHKAADAHATDLLRQASYYAIAHSLALLFICRKPGKAVCLACFLFALGILLFCGGLACKALLGAMIIPWLIPFGGGCLMAGWLAVAASFLGNSAQAA